MREQTHRAEQAELAVRLQQIRAVQAEARAAAAVSSEAVAQESLRQARDQRMQEWARSGTPVPAIGEDHVLLGTPVLGWGPLFGNPQAPPENPGRSTAAVEREAATQPLENRNLEDGELPVTLEARSAPEEGSPVSRMSDAILVLYPPSPFGLSCTLKCDPVPGRVVRVWPCPSVYPLLLY